MLDRARDIYDAAMALPRDQREEFLTRRAAAEPALLALLREMLDADDAPTTNLIEQKAGPARRPEAARMAAAPHGQSALGAAPASEADLRHHEGQDGHEGQYPHPGHGDQPPIGTIPGIRLQRAGPAFAGLDHYFGYSDATIAGLDRTDPISVLLMPRPDSIRAALVRYRLIKPQLDALTEPPLATKTPTARARSSLAATTSHVLSAGRTTDDRIYIVMPSILPTTLIDVMADHPMQVGDLVTVLDALSDALDRLSHQLLAHGRIELSSIRVSIDAATHKLSALQLAGVGLEYLSGPDQHMPRPLNASIDRLALAELSRTLLRRIVSRLLASPASDATASTSVPQARTRHAADLLDLKIASGMLEVADLPLALAQQPAALQLLAYARTGRPLPELSAAALQQAGGIPAAHTSDSSPDQAAPGQLAPGQPAPGQPTPSIRARLAGWISGTTPQTEPSLPPPVPPARKEHA